MAKSWALNHERPNIQIPTSNEIATGLTIQETAQFIILSHAVFFNRIK